LLADITVTRDVAQRGAFELWVCAAYIGNYTNTFRIYTSFIKQTSEATVLRKIQYPLQLLDSSAELLSRARADVEADEVDNALARLPNDVSFGRVLLESV
jgi:hypothetical protein